MNLYDELGVWAEKSRRNFAIGIALLVAAICIGVASGIAVAVALLYVGGTLFGPFGVAAAALLLVCGLVGAVAYLGAEETDGKWG